MPRPVPRPDPAPLLLLAVPIQAAKEHEEKLRQEAERAAKEAEAREKDAAKARQEMQTKLLEEQQRLQVELQEQVKAALGEAASAKRRLATQGLQNLKDKIVSEKTLKKAKAAGEIAGVVAAAKAVKNAEEDAARAAIEAKAKADADAEAAREELRGGVYEPPAGREMQPTMATGALSAARRASQLARRQSRRSHDLKKKDLGDLETRLDAQLARQTELLGIREEEARQKARQHVVRPGHALPPDRDRRRASAATHRSVAARQHHHVVLPSVGEVAPPSLADDALPPRHAAGAGAGAGAGAEAGAVVAVVGSTRMGRGLWAAERRPTGHRFFGLPPPLSFPPPALHIFHILPSFFRNERR